MFYMNVNSPKSQPRADLRKEKKHLYANAICDRCSFDYINFLQYSTNQHFTVRSDNVNSHLCRQFIDDKVQDIFLDIQLQLFTIQYGEFME